MIGLLPKQSTVIEILNKYYISTSSRIAECEKDPKSDKGLSIEGYVISKCIHLIPDIFIKLFEKEDMLNRKIRSENQEQEGRGLISLESADELYTSSKFSRDLRLHLKMNLSIVNELKEPTCFEINRKRVASLINSIDGKASFFDFFYMDEASNYFSSFLKSGLSVSPTLNKLLDKGFYGKLEESRNKSLLVPEVFLPFILSFVLEPKMLSDLKTQQEPSSSLYLMRRIKKFITALLLDKNIKEKFLFNSLNVGASVLIFERDLDIILIHDIVSLTGDISEENRHKVMKVLSLLALYPDVISRRSIIKLMLNRMDFFYHEKNPWYSAIPNGERLNWREDILIKGSVEQCWIEGAIEPILKLCLVTLPIIEFYHIGISEVSDSTIKKADVGEINSSGEGEIRGQNFIEDEKYLDLLNFEMENETVLLEVAGYIKKVKAIYDSHQMFDLIKLYETIKSKPIDVEWEEIAFEIPGNYSLSKISQLYKRTLEL